jgi:hypothetical protein
MERVNKQSNQPGLGLASFIIGIIALVLSPIPIINNLAFILGILALVLGLVAVKGKVLSNPGKARIGVILAVISLIVVIGTQMLFSKAVDEVSKELNETSQEINESIERSSGNRTDDILKNDLTVVLGDFKAVEGEYSTDTSLVATVTNKNAERKSYTVTVEAVDASGARISEDVVYANDLNPGQSQEFKLFEFESSDKIEALKNAEFKILEVSQS